MTALIWMLTWLLQVLPAVSELPQPVNLDLTSVHFSHMLKWEPGPGTPPGVYYHVSVNTERGTSYVPVSGCERVQHPLVCNLTEACSKPEQVYIINVTALLDSQASKAVQRRFKPIRDTQLDLPLLTVTPCGSGLCVDLQPPLEHLRKSYEALQYKLKITSHSGDKAQFMDTNLGTKNVTDLARGRQYCVAVCFSDSLEPRVSNYSQGVCAVTPAIFTADQLISAVLCLLVMSAVVVVALLISTGFICLMGRPLPLVLTSVHHIEEVLVVAYRSTSLSSLLNLKAKAPSSGEKRSHETLSDQSDGESVTETPGGSRGGDYKLRVGINLLSSSSSSSSSSTLSDHLTSELEPPPSFHTSQTSDFFNPQPEPLTLTETHSNAGLSPHPPSAPCPPADTDSYTVERTEPNEDEEVNLLTLTFGRHEEEVEEKALLDMAEVEPESSSASSVCEVIYNSTPVLPSQMWDTEEVPIETVSCSVSEEEEEEEEHSGYMGRPCTDVLQNSLSKSMS
ncbi:uncharacterized protein LOC119903522 [Micropterus salmoides]|uniref:uncharacterized protein LOC119903522 n=1 Tax=Micropterus salmoides TaxID=27706 RepID=UPI0018EB0970|nr:uncharacterized protein LOC119903522 [Micropterus salmoides]